MKHFHFEFDVKRLSKVGSRAGEGSPEKLRDVLKCYPWCNQVEMTPWKDGFHVHVDARRDDVGDVLLGRCGLHGFRIETVPTMVESDD